MPRDVRVLVGSPLRLNLVYLIYLISFESCLRRYGGTRSEQNEPKVSFHCY